jgi:hypothetical protein
MRTDDSRAGRRALRFGTLAAALAATLTGCASAGRLGEYDFRDRPVAVVTVAPPRPDVFTDDDFWLGGGSLLEVAVRVASDIARDVQAERARARLDSAVAVVNVPERMGARVLEQGARELRGRAVGDVQEADFEIELRVKRYGIEADSWDDQANFTIDADVLILDGEDRSQIWKAGVNEREAVSSGTLGRALPDAVGGVVTAGQLASLSVAEMARALEALADYCADRMIQKLRSGLEKARG